MSQLIAHGCLDQESGVGASTKKPMVHRIITKGGWALTRDTTVLSEKEAPYGMEPFEANQVIL